jgi:hypothetical protein
MFRREEWEWTFLGFWSRLEGQPVQDWYDGIPIDHKIEVTNLVSYIRNLTNSAWTRPFFDPLEGAGGISEIIIPDIRDEFGVAYYRIYGYFGPGKQQYTFLHATNKKVRNDRDGKAIARRRLEEIRNKDATANRFDFVGRSVVKIDKWTGSKN